MKDQRSLIKLIGWALCAALVGGGFVSVIVPAASAQASSVPSIVTCSGKYVERPASFVTACADGNAYFQSMKWSSWNSNSAVASATFVMNNCTPYCAAGKFVDYGATVRLSAPKVVAKHRVFTQLKATYRAGKHTLDYSFALITNPR